MGNVKDKLRKILLLAEMGKNGEAKAAQIALTRMLEKYNMTLEDIQSDTIREYSFKYSSADEKILFVHVIMTVCGQESDARHSVQVNTYRKTLYVKLTHIQFVDVSSMFEFHRSNLKREKRELLDSLLGAYVNKHRLFGSDHKNREETDVDWEKLERLWAIQNQLSDNYYHKQIQ